MIQITRYLLTVEIQYIDICIIDLIFYLNRFDQAVDIPAFQNHLDIRFIVVDAYEYLVDIYLNLLVMVDRQHHIG
jgi:hypothetical protein